VSTTDMMATTRYFFDGSRRLVATLDALGNLWTETYDQNGNPQSETQPIVNGLVKTTTFVYSGRNQLLAQINPDGDGSQTGYNAYGEVVAELDGRGFVTAHFYDQRGFESSVVQAFGTDQAITTTYIPDADGNVVQMFDPRNIETATIFDPDNRPIVIVTAVG